MSMPIPQGDLALLDSDVAQRLLQSTIPARYAYTGADGPPRIAVTPTWVGVVDFQTRQPAALGGLQG